MAKVIMRNRVSTEYRKVEQSSDEFWALRAELHTDGRPRWEQTGEHDLQAAQTRAESGLLRAEDFGDADQPVEQVVSKGDAYIPGLDRGWPTPGELAQNAGRAAEMTDEELVRIGSARTVVEGYPAGHPPQVDEGEAAEEGVRLDGGVSTAGDNPLTGTVENAEGDGDGLTIQKDETTGATGGGEPKGSLSGSSSGGDYNKQSPARLKQLAEDRGLDVQRGDGKEGDPLKADYISALEEDDDE